MIHGNNEVFVFVFSADDKTTTDSKITDAAYRFAELTCTDRLSLSQDAFKVERTERGKPFFPNCPEILFSVSHSEKHCVCAMAYFPIGIDLQKHVRLNNESDADLIKRLKAISKRFFNPAEYNYISEKETDTRFFTVWAAKESYVKFTGSGIDDNFSKSSVLPDRKDFYPVLTKNSPFCWQTGSVNYRAMTFGDSDNSYTMCICAESSFKFRIISVTDELPGS